MNDEVDTLLPLKTFFFSGEGKGMLLEGGEVYHGEDYGEGRECRGGRNQLMGIGKNKSKILYVITFVCLDKQC